MNESSAAPPAAPRRRFVFTRRHAWAAVALLLAAASLSGGGYYLWLTTPPPMPTTLPEAMELIQSPRYLRLPEQRRIAYLEQSRTLWEKLPSDEKRKMGSAFQKDPALREAVRTAMADQMLNQARQFAMGSETERRQLLDKVIGMQEFGRARWEKARAQRQAAAATQPADPQAQAQRNARRQQEREEGRKWMQNQIEHGDPQRQAYVSEFFKALRERRMQLGLPPEPAPPGRAPGNARTQST
jgi:hypothetical protein